MHESLLNNAGEKTSFPNSDPVFSTFNIALLTELRAKLEQILSHFVSDGTKYAAQH